VVFAGDLIAVCADDISAAGAESATDQSAEDLMFFAANGRTCSSTAESTDDSALGTGLPWKA